MAHLAVKDLTFTYPNCNAPAVEGVTFQVEKGEFLAVCGPTGCGKSTLLRLLKRELAPLGELSGEIVVDGVAQSALSERDAACRIGYVMQRPEQQIVTDKVWHELAFGLESLGYDTPTIRRRVAEIAAFFGIENWFYKNVTDLSGGQKQLLSLASVMAMQPDVLVLDEPTSSLGEKEVSQLMATCRDLKARGVGILFVSHKLEELFELCDRVTVIRDGQYIETRDIQDWTNDSLIAAMVGRTLENQFPKEFGTRGECMLKVENLEIGGVLNGVSFEAYGGEILGMSGLVGAGRTETVRAVFGADPIDGGKIYIKGKEVKIKSPKDAVEMGIGYLSEDRKRYGLCLNLSITDNTIMSSINKLFKGFFIKVLSGLITLGIDE
mgnify:CR=1 FL=1